MIKLTTRTIVLAVAAAALGCMLPLISARAQESRGTMIGRVTDASGAVMPGVEVRVKNVATSVELIVKTNESGSFNVPYLPPGAYLVVAEVSGFKRAVQEGVEVRISETVELNITMTVGEVSESIEIRSETPVLDTASSSLGQVIDERRVQELPLFAGNPTELTLLAPGVVNSTDMRLRKAAFNNAPSQFTSDGNGQYNNEFTIDGVSNTFASGSTARVAFSPPVYAVKEFKIQTSAYDASVGHTIGALTNLGTASGTNGLHGEAHLWERNSAFDAPNFFNNKNRTERAVYQDHRYGASAGGPVVLPKIYNGRNKTFWYYAWESNKWGVPTTFTGTVPTAAQRQGDFSALLRLGSQYQIYDPATTRAAAGGRFQRQPFANNIIPQNRLDPVGLRLINLWPLPNQAGTADGRNNYFNSFKAIENYYVHFVRFDHTFSDKHRVFGRVHYDYWQEDKNDWFANRTSAIILNRINRGFAFDDVYTLNPTTVLNVRYGLTYQEFPERRASRGFDLSSLGFSPALTRLTNPELATIPRVTIQSGTTNTYSQVAGWESGDGTNTSLTHSVTANITKLVGNHNLKFGTDVRFYRAFGNRFPQDVSPDLLFNNVYTRGPLDNAPVAPIGQELAALLLGIPAGSMTRAASYATQDKFFALFIQDDYKLTRKLTLNVGLRYELEAPFTERFDRLVGGFAFGQANPIEARARANYAASPIPELAAGNFRVPGGLTFVNQGDTGRSPFRGEKNNFLPRIGFAYQIDDKTVLRAGYGIYYDTLGVNTTQPIQTGFAQSTPIQASLDNGLTYVATTANPFPNGLLQPVGPSAGLSTNLGQAITFFDPNMKHPYAQRWSFGAQRELPGQFVADISYVGNRGTRIPVLRQYNNTPAQYLSTSPVRDQRTIDFLSAQFPNPFFGLDPIYGRTISRGQLLSPFPQFGEVRAEESIGYSWYHALQTRAEKRFSRGYTFQLAYTWSKLMEAVQFLNPADPTPSEVIGDFDRTHRLAMSGIWEIPVGRGRQFGAGLPTLVNGVIGNWQISGVATQQSGPPLGFGNRIFTGSIEDILLPAEERTADRWFRTDVGFNRNAAQQLASNIRTLPLRFGGVRGDNQVRWDFSLTKSFPIRESVRLQFRADVFNAWNQTNLNIPNTDPTNTAFGQVTSTTSEARSWQFAFKLTF